MAEKFKRHCEIVLSNDSAELLMWFVVSTKKRAASFKVLHGSYGLMGSDLSYHSTTRKKHYIKMTGTCRWLGGACWCSSSGIGAEKPAGILKNDGSDALYTHLEGLLREEFPRG